MDGIPGLPDDEWEEIAEGIPPKDEPFIQKFLQGREALIEQEHKQRSDHAFRQSLSPLAKEASAIVSRIRAEEQRTIWTPQFEEETARRTGVDVHPGMVFTLAKARMEGTRLWQIVRRMPKGALLHAHFDAMVDLDFLFATVLATEGMCLLCADGHLATRERRESGAVRFRFVGKAGRAKVMTGQGARGARGVWGEEYAAATAVPVADAAESFPEGGREGFLAWLKDRCTITRAEALEQHHGVDAVWKKFTSIFGIVDTMVHYEPVFRAFTRRLLRQLHGDGIKWVEIRRAFTSEYYREGADEPDEDYDELFRVFNEEIEAYKASEEGKGFWGVRLIWTSIRAMGTRAVVEDMDRCIAIKLAYPHIISGYDLVGQEDLGRPLKDLLPELFWFRKQCAQEGVDIPFFFHAGECLGDGDAADHNLVDAVLLGTRRIGHGFSLYKHPLLIDMVRERRVLVESCPISNEVLRLCASVLAHPLPALLARGVACALCNDDPALLGQDTEGMTHDFWQALQGWENLGLAGMGSLAENSVRWANFEDQTQKEWLEDIRQASLGDGIKAERLKEWAVSWEQYCLWIVTEFGDDGDSIRELRRESALDAQD